MGGSGTGLWSGLLFHLESGRIGDTAGVRVHPEQRPGDNCGEEPMKAGKKCDPRIAKPGCSPQRTVAKLYPNPFILTVLGLATSEKQIPQVVVNVKKLS